MINIEKRDNVAVVTIDAPDKKVNTLNGRMMEQLSSLLDDLESDDSLQGAVVVSGKENNFIAGADIGMIKACSTTEEFQELSRAGHDILLRIARSPKLVVACIHGTCLGGGAEFALACHYRILSDHRDTRIGFPEVKLGLIPGMGGTQRLPRLIGIQQSLAYMLTGKNMYSRQAARNGFADEVVYQHNLEKAGIEAVRRLAERKPAKRDRRRLHEKILEKNGAGRFLIFYLAHKRTAAQTRGNYPAPPCIIESVRHGYKRGFEAGLRNETRLFADLAVTKESRALVDLFFAMTDAKKNPDKARAKDVKSVAVLGAGLMGSGIAEVSLENGYHVWLKDRTLEQVGAAGKSISDNLQKSVDRKILTGFERDARIGRLHPVSGYEGFGRIDLVIEAVFEDLEVKRAVVKEVEARTGETCIFASNTSSLPISEIAAGAERPQNIVGMHYFSPVPKMPLLEVVKTKQTAPHVTATARQVGLDQGKTVIVVNDGHGFYTTRILVPYINEALLLLEEGAEIEQLDRVMKNFGFPVGPVTLMDEVGIDVGAHIADVLSGKFRSRGAKTSTKARELVNADYKGRKNGKGFYKYGQGKGKKKEVNPDIYNFFGGQQRTRVEEEEIRERLSLVMINEAVLCLQEKILQSPVDGDLGAVLGLGFPPFLGGPFRYIDSIGPERIADRMRTLQQDHDNRFKPAGLLLETKSFY